MKYRSYAIAEVSELNAKWSGWIVTLVYEDELNTKSSGWNTVIPNDLCQTKPRIGDICTMYMDGSFHQGIVINGRRYEKEESDTWKS
jgi:hypothetical protein